MKRNRAIAIGLPGGPWLVRRENEMTEGHWFDPHTLKPETQDDAFRSDFYGKLCGLIYEYQSIGMSPEFITEVIGYTINQFAQYKIGFWDEEAE